MRYNALIDSLQNLINYKPSQAELSKILNVSRANISAKANRNSNIDDDALLVLEKHYNISFSQQNVVNNNLVNVLPCCASCGNGITIDTSLIYNYDKDAKYIYAFASGSSMSPVIEDKDIVLAKKYDGNFIDGIYLFNIGDDFFIKTLAKNVNQIECISANPQYDKIVLRGQELDKLVILGSVVGIVRRF